ncbi:MAG TPA: M56 family metallopeptidase [Oscillospiraceae bacterium]|nr:M56 family metallopeptidase [Oscillospiraceae bacterium]
MRSAVMTILSLSLSGSAMALLLLMLRPVLAGRVSKRFGYYVWLLVLLRLCLPVSGSVSFFTAAGAGTESSVTAGQTAAENPSAQSDPDVRTDPAQEAVPTADAAGTYAPPEETRADAPGQSLWDAAVDLAGDPAVWFWIWAAGALGTCAWYVLGYLRFSAGVGKSGVPAEGEAARILEELCPRRRPRLLVSPAVDTPMLLGIFRPAVVLPDRRYDGGTLRSILRHELCHDRRGDLYYKWFAMVVFSLHWFNPLLYFVRRELAHACELACDEAVIRDMTADERRRYGETLLALAGGGNRPAGILATTMSEEKRHLKGRLLSIMNYKKTSVGAAALSLVIALALCGCGAVFGAPESASPSPSPSSSPSAETTPLTDEEIAWFNTEFFNGGDFNIHNQFITSLYEKPMDVDLYELFYLGTGYDANVGYDSEEYKAVLAAAGIDTDPDCGCEKVSVSAMDKVLTENMGLTLAGTSGIGLEQMIFVE